MKKTFATVASGRARFFASAGVAALSLSAFASPAFAQVVEATPDCVDDDSNNICDIDEQLTAEGNVTEDSNVITVTGSRIRVREADSPRPIVTLNQEYLDDRNITNVADALNELPIYSGSVTPAGAQGSFGQGVNFLNTFGLGSNRNLTLINGRRFVNSNPPTVFNNAGAGTQVDLNVIPTILVDRTETVAIGGAPIYGSDAIASTTNVILRTDYEGISVTGLTGISEQGDNFRYQLSAVGGINLLDDRLNVTVAFSRDEEDGLLFNERDFFRENVSLLRNLPTDGARPFRVNPNLGDDNLGGIDDPDGNPPFALFRGVRIPTLSRSGRIVTFTEQGTLDYNNLGLGALDFGAPGQLVPFNEGFNTGGRDNVGGDGFAFNDFAQITSDVERTSGNAFVTFEVVDNIEVYGEGTYFFSRADELVQQPTFNTPLFGFFGVSSPLVFSTDNPFLSDSARNTLESAGVEQFFTSRASLDLVDPTGFGENEIYRGVVGVRGEFDAIGRTFNFDASYNRGTAEVTTFGEQINQQRFVNAVNVTRTANGNIVCDPTPDLNAVTFAGGLAPVADANCVPLNTFGDGARSQAALDYITEDTTVVATLDQEVFNFNIGSTIFDLYGAGPIGFNVGYERRTEEGEFIPDEFTEQGLGRSVAIPRVSGEYTIDEVFGEVLVPLVSPSNDFFIHSAELNGAVRFVDNTINGTFTAFTAGGRIAVIPDIEIRGNFTRSFRAPAISELFSPLGNAFATVPQPCENPDAGPNPEVRQRNCDAFLAAFPNANDDPSGGATIPILTGGNTELQNEEADSYTFGVVLQPRFLDRFVLAVDYLNINLTQPIQSLTVGDIVTGCFDNPDFDTSDPANGNQFCSLIRRNPAGTQGQLEDGTTGDTGGFVINDPLNPGVTTGFINGVEQDFEAIQGVLSYTMPNIFGAAGDLTLSGNALYVIRREFNDLGVVTDRTDGTFGDPSFTAQLNVRYTQDAFGALFSTNFVGRQLASRDDDLDIDVREFNRRDEYATFNTSVFFDVEDDFRFTFAVTNLLDRNFQNSYFGSYNGIADSIGRRFSASVRLQY